MSDEPRFNVYSTVITGLAIVAGTVLVALGHAPHGAALFTFAAGVAAFKPIGKGL
jgi:hypothetical protein